MWYHKIGQCFYEEDGAAAGSAPAASPVASPATSEPQSSASSTPSASSTESQPVTATQAQSTTQPSANTENNGAESTDKTIVAGGLKLIKDPRTGRNIVVTLANEQPKAEETPATATEQLGTPNPNALPTQPTPPQVPDDKNNPGLVEPQVGQVAAENKAYKPYEMLVAMNLGQVDESRIPANFKPQYEAYKAQKAQAEAAAKAQSPEEAAKAQQEQNIKFYSQINNIAEQMAYKELGVTKADLEAAEFSDDTALTAKVQQFKAAVDFNRNKIFADIQTENAKKQATEQQQRAEHDAIYNDVVSFTRKMQKEEPNFTAIDKMMVNRYRELPYEQAKDIEPAIIALQQGSLTRQQAAILEQYYNDTRKAYYAKASGVGTIPAPVVQKPPVVEAPGSVTVAPAPVDYSKLRKMNFNDKIKFIGQVLNKQK